MRLISLLSVWACMPLCLLAQLSPPELSYYLPSGQSFDANIPPPSKVLGFEIGEWHVTHDQQLRYMERLASVSDRIQVDTIGYTHEGRPQIHLLITSAEKQSKLEELRQQHLGWTDPARSQDMQAEETPLVVWMGYSIHGDEASGGNAALLMAYYLAAAEGARINSVLDKTVIILDPCYNPDGFQRYSTWVNMHKGTNVLQTHGAHREHNEVWPTGRTNHYWFDLNRDWLPVQHPESQARIRRFHQWKPNFLTDHHEMGTNSTFFFQPGIPSRNNPMTPDRVFDLTEKVASYHAQYLDEIGSLYYSKESFDDFYYGKGSTYPDINGGVGILFEQASVEGHAQKSSNGILTFPFAIRNHFTTSLSTLYGTHALRGELLEHQRTFFEEAATPPARSDSRGYVVKAPQDRYRLKQFIDLLSLHQIEVSGLPRSVSANGKRFIQDKDLFVSLQQPQRRLIRAIFEPVTEFQDSLFYDVSTWTLPMAFDLVYAPAPVGSISAGTLKTYELAPAADKLDLSASPYAFLIPPFAYQIPRFLNRCFAKGIRVKVATEPFVSENRPFPRGTYLLTLGQQDMQADSLAQWVAQQAEMLELPVVAAPTGHTEGVNLGSNAFQLLEPPKPLIVIGSGVTSYEAGEVWHLLDTRYEMELTMVEMSSLNSRNLEDFNTLILVNGNYGKLKQKEAIGDWLKKGGTIIAYKGALNWIAGQGWTSLEFETADKDTADFSRTYAEQSKIRGAQVIGGAICKAFIDRTHPLGFGFEQDTIHLFRNSSRFMRLTDQPFTSPVRYTNAPLASGYISAKNEKALRNTAAVNVYKVGRGEVIAMTDNPNFRAFWYGTNRLFANALFLGKII